MPTPLWLVDGLPVQPGGLGAQAAFQNPPEQVQRHLASSCPSCTWTLNPKLGKVDSFHSIIPVIRTMLTSSHVSK